MADVKLKGPVGFAGRKSGDKVKNILADVELVRAMLVANGVKVETTGKCDAKLVKAIAAYQKKIGFKTPDQVIDPGGKTIKSLRAKYQASQKKAPGGKQADASGKGATGETRYQIKYKNQVVELTKAEYEQVKAKALKRTEGYVKGLAGQHKINLSIVKDYEESAKLSNDFAMATVQFLVVTIGRVKYPNKAIVAKATKAIADLEKAHKAKDLAAFEKALPAAQLANAEFHKEVQRFLAELIGNAEKQIKVAKGVRTGAFVVLGAIAAPAIVTAGASATTATLVGAAGVSVLDKGSEELMRHLSGEDVSLGESATNVAVDATVSLVTAGLGTKIKFASTFGDDIAAATAPKLAKVVPGVTVTKLQPLLKRYIKATGEEVLKTAAGEAVKVAGSVAKSGKAPTQKDAWDAAQAVAFTALTAGVMKDVQTFQKKFAYQNKVVLRDKLIPTLVKSTISNRKTNHVLNAQAVNKVMAAVETKVFKAVFDSVLDDSNGTESADQMLKKAEQKIMTDPAVRKQVQSLVDAELKAMAGN